MPRRRNDMPKRIISELSDEQEAMLPFYRDKWRSIQISTESIQQEKVAAVIKAAYAVSDYPEPYSKAFASDSISRIRCIQLALTWYRPTKGSDRLLRSEQPLLEPLE